MKKKLVALAVVAALMLVGATLAFGGARPPDLRRRRVRQARLARRRQRAPAAGVDHAPAGDRGGQERSIRLARQVDLDRFAGRACLHGDVGGHRSGRRGERPHRAEDERPLAECTRWMLNVAPPATPISRTQSATYSSWPRAAVMSPRSRIRSAGQPKLSSSSTTRALASSSFPLTKTSCSPGRCSGRPSRSRSPCSAP